MKRACRRRSVDLRDERGMTLIEMLVASLMSVIIVGASCAMLISAVRDQPALSNKAQNVTTARYQLERVVREIRNGVNLVPPMSATEVTMVTRVRRVSCGGAIQTDPKAQPVECIVTYRCSGKSCTRTEATLGGTTVGTATALSGIGSTDVFCFVPSAESDPTQCGPAKAGVTPTYVGINLQVPNPEGPGLLTVSEGATLRTATFEV